MNSIKRSTSKADRGVALDGAQHMDNEDNSNVKIISAEEIPDMKKDHISPAKTQIQLHCSMENSRGLELANIVKGNKVRIEGSSRRNLLVHFNGNKYPDVGNKRKETEQLQNNENKFKWCKNASKALPRWINLRS